MPGREVASSYGDEGPTNLVDAAPLLALLRAGIEVEDPDPDLPLAKPAFTPSSSHKQFTALWKGVATALSVANSLTQLRDVVRACIDDAADRLLWACWEANPNDSGRGGRTRATPVSELAATLFGVAANEWSYEQRLLAVRSLLFVRGAGDALKRWLERSDVAPPSFASTPFLGTSRAYTLPPGTELARLQPK